MPLDFVQVYGPIASCVAAVAALAGGVFAFLNWARNQSQDKPRIRLDRPNPVAGMIETKIHIENRGQKDILVTAVELQCGTFAGQIEYDTLGGVAGYARTDKTRKSISLLVPSGITKSTPVLFHTDAPLVHVSLARRHKDYVAVISAYQR
jgi:hypothetical protein